MKFPRFVRHFDILRTLYRSSPVKLEHILQHIDSNLMNTLSELSLNILKGIIKLSPQRFKKLRKYRTYIKALASRTASLRKKRKIFQEHPDLVTHLLGPLFQALRK